MLIAHDSILETINGGFINISTIYSTLSDIVISQDETTKILAIKHHKHFKVMTKLIFDDDSYVIIGKNTYIQIVEEHDLGRIIEAKDAHPGQKLCPPIPPYADIRIWGSEYGKNIKQKQTVFYRASTVLFDKCEYVKINNAIILHDNYEFNVIRKIAKKSNSVANLLLKHAKLTT